MEQGRAFEGVEMSVANGEVRRKNVTVGVVAVVAGAIFFLVGFTLGRAGEGGDQPTPVAPDVIEDVGPSRISSGVPVGYARTRAGAIQAALNYARAMTPDPGESKQNYESKLRTIAAEEWGEELESTIKSWSEGEAEVAVLRYKVADFNPDRADVALWLAGFVNPRNGSEGGVWGRSFISLRWERDDWKVASEDGDEGPWPSPLAQSSSAAELQQLLEGFESFDYEPASQP
jgi:hypothetical protein